MLNFKLSLTILACCIAFAGACPCFGQGSCNLDGTRSFNGETCNTGYCDCCPVCNSCNQLLAGCLSNMQKPLIVSAYNSVFHVGQAITPITLFGNQTCLYNDLCIKPELPAGITHNRTSVYEVVFSGVPTETVAPTEYTVVVKGCGGFLGRAILSFGVDNKACSNSQPTTTGSNTSGNNGDSCTLGYARCTSATSYQQCAYLNRNGDTYWAPTQFCGVGTTCKARDTNYIACN
eukprot:TRINITY_DN1628_c0_g2_i3.p1 TRINITY_DN1628_c0_g2~~TRINITY_DN1628_c0_g2_i3.p1  ORF type:complete len:233 (-),score=40.53 TRINITY_DN1628_c0_g2_i3:96-794(-)